MNEQISPERLRAFRARLTQDGIDLEWNPSHGLQYELASYFDELTPALCESAHHLIEICHDYITKAVLTDQFDNDHDARRSWRDEVLTDFPEFSSIFKHTKLSINSFQAIYAHLDVFLRQFEQSDAPNGKRSAIKVLAEQWLPSSQFIQHEYSTLSIEEKRRLASEFSETLEMVIDVLKK